MTTRDVYADAEAVARAAADYLHEQIRACLADKDYCHVALPGGSTPGRCLELLADKELAWVKIHWYLGDERCYPSGHPERNDSMIQQRFWSKIATPSDRLHPIPADLGPEAAADRYASLISQIGPLDIIILGMGEDGHTASLFPGNPAVEDRRAVVPVFNAPKPPAERVSLGLVTLQQAAQRVVLVTGENKRAALARIDRGETLPIGLIGPARWFVDRAAAYQPTKDML